jgi:hypothetical protein
VRFKLVSPLVAFAIVLSSTSAAASTKLIFTVTGNATEGRPIVEGVTNLPDGTQLLLTLSRAASGYNAQDKLSVQNGRFRSGQFSNRGEPLLPGSYSLELVGPVTAVQPTASALGKDYANFTSALLKRGKFGATLEYRATLAVPGQSNSAADAAARRTADQERVAWLRKSCSEIPGISERLTGKKISKSDAETLVKDCIAGKTR